MVEKIEPAANKPFLRRLYDGYQHDKDDWLQRTRDVKFLSARDVDESMKFLFLPITCLIREVRESLRKTTSKSG